MKYKIKSVRIKNFKCFDSSKYHEFTIDDYKNPIILTGPNGFGKTTFFDAIELVFSKRITRFNTSIENKNTDLQKNVLLNEASIDGYIVCTLINDNKEYLTLLAIIDHNMHKVSYTDSIQYGIIQKSIPTAELDEVISGYEDWRSSIDDFNLLNYSKENFNVYYYVSQAESVHFLKQSIAARKNTMDALLDLGNVNKWVEFLRNKLIGKTEASSNVIINDEIKKIDQEINSDIQKLKGFTNISDNQSVPDFMHIIKCETSEQRPFWDCKNLENVPIPNLEKGINDIDRISKFVEDYSDYENYLWNRKLDSALVNGIDDYLLSREYIENNKVDLNKIRESIDSKELIINIFNNSSFLKEIDVDPYKYSVDGILKLEEIFPECILFDIKEVENICNQLKSISESLSAKQAVINDLESARNALQEVNLRYDSNSDKCPYCGTLFGEAKKLKAAYESAHALLECENDDELKKYKELKIQLKAKIKDSQKVLIEKIGEFDEDAIHDLLDEISRLSSLIIDNKRIEDIEFFIPFFVIDTAFEKMGRKEESNELRRIALASKKTYTNENFTNNLEIYNYSSIPSEYPNIEWKKQNLFLKKNIIESKISYIRNSINARNNEEMREIKMRLKENIKRWNSLKAVREDLKNIQKIYSEAINIYKNEIMKKLRVPLLIYTGKLLQDYQNGLGVFISKDEMRFVTNGDVKHDILNTFSSGQLTGFVLAFLFAMNKQYVKESEDDLGFILIDDPVQTMDDINIYSMIEVLRNDFSDKQIILSTHENDKENYILYKFYKYNKIGQSLNVKNELYGV